MITLNAEKRSMDVKAKKLRREGYVTGVLNLTDKGESIPLKYDEKEARKLIKENKPGSQVTLVLDGEKISTIIKDFNFDAMRGQILALNFQNLVAGEEISTEVSIKLLNEDFIEGVVNQQLSDIQYKADPQHLLDEIVIDFKELDPSITNYSVADLKLADKEGITLITPEDAVIFAIIEPTATEETEDTDADATAAPTVAAE
ncbi:MAG TPA: 50S ribosomal protein L25/general stress protein Ctc [Candidatus Dorea intestinavium]|nr:50S ribosomal protein L25/general stress protein Ctc [Candidatus Dorea intestinavium]